MIGKNLVALSAFLLVSSLFVTGCTTSAQKPPAKTDATVEFTGIAYKPNIINIKKGQTITFENKSNTSMWPASSPHPTHDIYPEFDPQDPIPTGKSWSFTFDKVGTWKFHDHLNPALTGEIHVQ